VNKFLAKRFNKKTNQLDSPPGVKDADVYQMNLPREDMEEGPMWDKVKSFGKAAGEKVMRHADITGYTKAKQNFEKWIDSHPELASEKENLLAKFDAEAEEDPHTPWDWGKDALAKWKEEQKSGAVNQESNDELSRVKALAGM
jgi:CHAD domain-containing protein